MKINKLNNSRTVNQVGLPTGIRRGEPLTPLYSRNPDSFVKNVR